MLVTRAGLAAACVAAAALATAPAASGDADPASDFLPTQDVFLPYQPRVSDALARDLRGVTAAAKRAGYPIKIAIIAAPADLGGVPNFFNKPRQYAPFLGREISFNKKDQPLLVVMPNGLGTFQAGPRAEPAVADVKVEGDGSDGMARAAVEAVQKLARAAGHPIRGFKPSASSGGGGGGATTALIFGVPVALLVLALAFLSYRRAGSDEEEESPAT